MARADKVTFRIPRIVLMVDWMVSMMARMCVRRVRTILRIV